MKRGEFSDKNSPLSRFCDLDGLAGANQAAVGSEAAPELAEVQTPLFTAPTEERDVAVTTRVSPDSACKDERVLPPLFGNGGLVPKHCLGVMLAKTKVLGPFQHRFAGNMTFSLAEDFRQFRPKLAFLGRGVGLQFPVILPLIVVEGGSELEDQRREIHHESQCLPENLLAVGKSCPELLAGTDLSAGDNRLVYEAVVLSEIRRRRTIHDTPSFLTKCLLRKPATGV